MSRPCGRAGFLLSTVVAASAFALAAAPAPAARNGPIVATLEDWSCTADFCEFQAAVDTLLVRPDGGRLWRLPVPAGSEGAQVSGDGDLLAFSLHPRGIAISTSWGLFTRVIETREISGFDWAPSGRTLVFAREDGQRDRVASLVLFDARRGRARRLGLGYDPVWSPHGQQIAFMRRRRSGGLPLRLMTVRPDGRGVRTVRTFSRRVRSAWVERWSDDGRSLVYLASRRANGGYAYRFSVSLATGRIRSMGQQTAAQLPIVSPDGRLVAYGGSAGIHIAPRGGGRSRVIGGPPKRWNRAADEWYVTDWQALP